MAGPRWAFFSPPSHGRTGLSQIPVGLLIDRFGPRRSLTLGLCLWSLAQTAAGAVGGLGQFIAARIALGIGEAPMYLSGTKVCTAWFHARDRAWPIGLFNASSALGPAVAPPLLTALMLGFGWRWMFAILGIAGGAVAIAWAVLYRDPEMAGIPGPSRNGYARKTCTRMPRRRSPRCAPFCATARAGSWRLVSSASCT